MWTRSAVVYRIGAAALLATVAAPALGCSSGTSATGAPLDGAQESSTFDTSTTDMRAFADTPDALDSDDAWNVTEGGAIDGSPRSDGAVILPVDSARVDSDAATLDAEPPGGICLNGTPGGFYCPKGGMCTGSEPYVNCIVGADTGGAEGCGNIFCSSDCWCSSAASSTCDCSGGWE